MIDFAIKGAIFDVDDTLLDNKSAIPGKGLHVAVQQIWDDYLCTLRQMPLHYLQADGSKNAPRTALHLLA